MRRRGWVAIASLKFGTSDKFGARLIVLQTVTAGVLPSNPHCLSEQDPFKTAERIA